MTDREICANCKFMVVDKCRRYPPQIIVFRDTWSGQQVDSAFPKTGYLDHCGEYVKKENTEDI